jgi:hypothetical protein
MDDNPTDIGVKPTGGKEVSSESTPAETIQVNETVIKIRRGVVRFCTPLRLGIT